MAGGEGTHATQNRLAMVAAVEQSLRVSYEHGATAGTISDAAKMFLSALGRRGHVVGHATDRHHELQALCDQLLARFDAWVAVHHLVHCPGCDAIVGLLPPMFGLTEPVQGVHAEGCLLEAIRQVVANPLRPEAGQ